MFIDETVIAFLWKRSWITKECIFKPQVESTGLAGVREVDGHILAGRHDLGLNLASGIGVDPIGVFGEEGLVFAEKVVVELGGVVGFVGDIFCSIGIFLGRINR